MNGTSDVELKVVLGGGGELLCLEKELVSEGSVFTV